MESYPDSDVLLNCDNDDYSQGYAQKKQAFSAVTKDNIFPPDIGDDNFRTSNVRPDDVGYDFYVFDIRYQQIFTASQPIKMEFQFHGVVPKKIN